MRGRPGTRTNKPVDPRRARRGCIIGIQRNGGVDETVERVIFDGDKIRYKGNKYRLHAAPLRAPYLYFIKVGEFA